jgi:hypothetical protein
MTIAHFVAKTRKYTGVDSNSQTRHALEYTMFRNTRAKGREICCFSDVDSSIKIWQGTCKDIHSKSRSRICRWHLISCLFWIVAGIWTDLVIFTISISIAWAVRTWQSRLQYNSVVIQNRDRENLAYTSQRPDIDIQRATGWNWLLPSLRAQWGNFSIGNLQKGHREEQTQVLQRKANRNSDGPFHQPPIGAPRR